MLKIILFLCMLFAATALECRISNGVEYVNIRGNLQPDGCPDGLKCVNETCSTIQKSNTSNSTNNTNGELAGLACAVSLNGRNNRSISVYIKANGDVKNQPWNYTHYIGCGSKDGKNLTCVGDWGEKWEEECPEGTWPDMGKMEYSEKCRRGCGTVAFERNGAGCDSNSDYARGTCRPYGDDGWTGDVIVVVVLICCLVAIGLCCCGKKIVTGRWFCE